MPRRVSFGSFHFVGSLSVDCFVTRFGVTGQRSVCIAQFSSLLRSDTWGYAPDDDDVVHLKAVTGSVHAVALQIAGTHRGQSP